jgi:hypothetical protein
MISDPNGNEQDKNPVFGLSNILASHAASTFSKEETWGEETSKP